MGPSKTARIDRSTSGKPFDGRSRGEGYNEAITVFEKVAGQRSGVEVCAAGLVINSQLAS